MDNSENGEVCKAGKINITVENGGNGTVDIYSNETVETAGNQKRVTSKETAPDNEKYAFRCFLLKLGFRNFEGSSAFKSGAKKEYSPGCDPIPTPENTMPFDVEEAKERLKDPAVQEEIKAILNGVGGVE